MATDMEHSPMERNISLSFLDEVEAADVAQLSPDVLDTLDAELQVQELKIKHRRAMLCAGLAERYSLGMKQAFNGEPFGTAHFADGAYDVKVEIRKNVSWDQAKLIEACSKLEAAGHDATEYVTTKIEVAESRFKGWPASIQSLFVPARTTRPEKPKITLARRKAEAA
jgi:hypothetical protein